MDLTYIPAPFLCTLQVMQLLVMDTELYGSPGSAAPEERLGLATAAVDQLMASHILPMVPHLLRDEDPMPLYALKQPSPCVTCCCWGPAGILSLSYVQAMVLTLQHSQAEQLYVHVWPEAMGRLAKVQDLLCGGRVAFPRLCGISKINDLQGHVVFLRPCGISKISDLQGHVAFLRPCGISKAVWHFQDQ
eukprot:1160572-Pelagomonas_calceolata.AAC.5